MIRDGDERVMNPVRSDIGAGRAGSDRVGHRAQVRPTAQVHQTLLEDPPTVTPSTKYGSMTAKEISKSQVKLSEAKRQILSDWLTLTATGTSTLL